MMCPGFVWLFRAHLALGLFLDATLSALSETSNPAAAFELTVATDRPEAIYHQGDSVIFSIHLRHNSEPVSAGEVNWKISKDGVAPVTNGRVILSNGAASVTGKLDEPGFLQCSVSFAAPDKGTVSAVAGAAVDALQIKPSLPVPDDFDAFWAEQKKRLAAIPVNPRLTPVASPKAKVEGFDLQADSVGAPVSGYFARPSWAKPKSLPIILTVHGAGVASSSMGSAAGWASRGFLALDLNAHGIPNGRPEQFYADLWKGELKDYYFRGRESRETYYFVGVFLRLVRAIDFLTAQPEWDGRTVIVHGSSQGGAQALVAAGLDPRVTFFAAGVPAMCDHTGTAVGRVNGWPKLVPKDAEGQPDPKVTQVARYYDAMNFVTRTHAAGIVTVGFIDGVCPPTSVYAAYNAIKGRKQIFNDPPSGHNVSKPASEAMRKAIAEHVASH
jgi:cephalosporin-C deacetylase